MRTPPDSLRSKGLSFHRLDVAGTLRAFLASPELTRLAPDDRDLIWAHELLDTMDCAGWTWNDLDIDGLRAALLDGLRWSLTRARAEPLPVARMLDALIAFAGRQYGAPHAAECCRYLGSRAALEQIRRWTVAATEGASHG